ncbi:MAG: CapA family protein [Oscillospiraceae bacterium]
MKRNGFITGLMYVLLVLLAVGLAVMIFLNFQANREQMEAIEAAEIAAATTPTPSPSPTPEPTPTPERATDTITLTFAGDIIGQPGLSTAAASGEDDEVSYDFYSELDGVTNALSGSDLSTCTLVGTMTTLAGYDEGYNLPSAMATALAGAGFQLVNAATDHILDQGLDGLVDTVHALQDEGLNVAGAYASAQAHGAYMASVHDVNVAFLSYTYGTGGVSVVDNSWCVDVYTTDYMTGQEQIDYDRIDADIEAVRNAGADIVVVYLYWWDSTQYYTVVRQNQSDMAQHLFESGADVLIGSGIKTPQPIETVTVERADGTKANCVACYSLSNLMSCFNDQYTNLSAVAKIQVSRDTDTGETWVSGVSYRPMFMLDTADYADYTDPGFKYRLLDAYDAIDDYEDGGETDLTELSYAAVTQGVTDLQNLVGADYDEKNGGVSLEFPY